jgi:subtilisin-like proprotein convertase family protein
LRVEDFIYVTNFVTFANTNPIAITDNQRANVYPAAIHVPCLWPQELTKIQVGIVGLSHTFPSDVCIMLASPSGKATPLMINCGGGRDFGLNNVDVVFDAEGEDLPFASQIFSGTYRPTVYGTNVAFPDPAPLAPNIGLDQFADENCHGDWSLYVFDDRIIDSGSISSGWTLTLFLTEAHAPYFVSPHVDDTGIFTATLIGDANHPHRIESSADFSNWSAIATNTLPEGTWTFTNSAPSTLLFYRAVRLP